MRFRCATLVLVALGVCLVARSLADDDCGWSTEQVGTWLDSIGLGRFRSVFAEKRVTGCELFSLSHARLRSEFGMAKFADRDKIISAVNEWLYFGQEGDPYAAFAEQQEREAAAAQSPLLDELLLTCGSASRVPDELARIPRIDVCYNATFALPGHHMQRLPVPNGSVRVLHVSGVLHRYSHRLVNLVLADWWRVLRVGGSLSLFDIPSLRFIADQYMAGRWNASGCNAPLFGAQHDTVHGSDFTFVAFDEQTLPRRLEQMGFRIPTPLYSDLATEPNVPLAQRLMRVRAVKWSREAPTLPAEAQVSLLQYASQPARGAVPSPLPTPLLLNLGCGRDVREGFLNIDLWADHPSVIAMNVSQLALPDHVADFILASDILEHFPYAQSVPLLREWRRVLKPSGVLQVRCPQFARQMQAYASGVWDADVASVFIFAGQTSPGDFHMVAFDRPEATRQLHQAGLRLSEYTEPPAPQHPLPGQINMLFHAVPAPE